MEKVLSVEISEYYYDYQKLPKDLSMVGHLSYKVTRDLIYKYIGHELDTVDEDKKYTTEIVLIINTDDIPIYSAIHLFGLRSWSLLYDNNNSKICKFLKKNIDIISDKVVEFVNSKDCNYDVIRRTSNLIECYKREADNYKYKYEEFLRMIDECKENIKKEQLKCNHKFELVRNTIFGSEYKCIKCGLTENDY